MTVSSGFIAYRIKEGKIEFFVGHPGGPYYKTKEYYTFLKGKRKDIFEDLFENAKREFLEESGLPEEIIKKDVEYTYLGFVKQPKKFVHAFLVPLDIDPNVCHSNKAMIEYPKNSENYIEILEVDKYKWMSLDELKGKTHPLHIPLYEKAIGIINSKEKC